MQTFYNRVMVLYQDYYRLRTTFCCADYVKSGSCERTDCIFVHRRQMIVPFHSLPPYPFPEGEAARHAGMATGTARTAILELSGPQHYTLSLVLIFLVGHSHVEKSEKCLAIAAVADSTTEGMHSCLQQRRTVS